jgi:menaquinone-dependent protoporphyrinogen IX oxidase
MKTLVLYYSLSGTMRTVAASLARDLGADVEEIRCPRYRPGVWGAVRAAYDSWADRLPAIEPLTHTVSAYDLVVVGGPIWASRPATPVRACLRREAGRLSSVAFVLTLGGNEADKAFREMEALAGLPPRATLAVREGDVKAGQFASAVRAFAGSLQATKAA